MHPWKGLTVASSARELAVTDFCEIYPRGAQVRPKALVRERGGNLQGVHRARDVISPPGVAFYAKTPGRPRREHVSGVTAFSAYLRSPTVILIPLRK